MSKRARSVRRTSARELERLVRDRRKLFLLDRGGTVEHPIEVSSSSVIEPHARALECARCGPQLRIVDQVARVIHERVRRVVSLRCTQCGEERTVHYSIVPPLVQ